ncbi:hypothetical protein EG329_013700 [Mollisiaceae sp. DMI_Dod_QoI]|nr:hypothetical protein EG329_013700 [Helotiales sp. DMI_Dod_QoI]
MEGGTNFNPNLDTLSETMEDFNFPSPERIALLERLQAAIGGAPPHFWAACQICDLNALEKLIKCGREYPGILRIFAQQTYTMAHYFAALNIEKINAVEFGLVTFYPTYKKTKDFKFTSTTSKSAWHGSTEAAYIYPYHSIKYKEEDIFGQRHTFWDQLRNFWSEEKVAAWQAELFPADLGGICGNGTEKVYNLITLSRTAHDLWGRGAFALKPILESDDKMALEHIESGDYFKFQTDDPKTKPLPSFQLLEMQWFLQRIQGMAGATDFDWPPLSDSGSDSDYAIKEVPDLGLDDDVEDLSLLSKEPLSSPVKLNSPLHPKHVAAKVEEDGDGDGGSNFVM